MAAPEPPGWYPEPPGELDDGEAEFELRPVSRESGGLLAGYSSTELPSSDGSGVLPSKRGGKVWDWPYGDIHWSISHDSKRFAAAEQLHGSKSYISKTYNTGSQTFTNSKTLTNSQTFSGPRSEASSPSSFKSGSMKDMTALAVPGGSLRRGSMSSSSAETSIFQIRKPHNAGMDPPSQLAASAHNKYLRKDLVGALDDSIKALNLDPSIQRAWRTKYKAEYDLGKFDDVIISTNGALTSGVEHEFDWMYQAMAKVQMGDYNGALRACEEGFRINGMVGRLYSTRGLALMYIGSYERALQDFTECVRLEPNSVQDWCNRAMTRLCAGDAHGSISDCTEAIRINAIHLDAWVYRAAANNYYGDHVGAARDASKAIRLDQNCAEAWSHRAEAKLRQEDFLGTLDDASKAIFLDQDLASAYTHRGEAKFHLKDYKGCILDCQRACQLDADCYPRAWCYNARAKFQRGQYADAVANANHAVVMDASFQLAERTLERAKLAVKQLKAWRIPLVEHNRAWLNDRDPPPLYGTSEGSAMPSTGPVMKQLKLPPPKESSEESEEPGTATESSRRVASPLIRVAEAEFTKRHTIDIAYPSDDPAKKLWTKLSGGQLLNKAAPKPVPKSSSMPDLAGAAGAAAARLGQAFKGFGWGK